MKSEHRHELEANSLAGFLNNLPQHLRTHSNKILLVVAGVLAVFALMRYRDNQKIEQDFQTRNALATAWDAVGQLRNMQVAFLRLGPSDVANLSKQRDDLIDLGDRNAQQVLTDSDKSKDAARMASAWLARGELYWALSNLPTPVEATTQPSLAPKTSATAALDVAANAYQTILKDFPDQVQPVITARFSLAAIAENKGDFAAAQEQYKALIESTSSSPADKAIAEQRIAKVGDLQKPLLLLAATQPATKPAITDSRSVIPGITNMQLGLGPEIPATQASPATLPTTAPTTQPK